MAEFRKSTKTELAAGFVCGAVGVAAALSAAAFLYAAFGACAAVERTGKAFSGLFSARGRSAAKDLQRG